MSLDLNEYFKLGLDSTENSVQQSGLINTIRTPTDTVSTHLNRITFKVPKIGLLTADSHIVVQITNTDGATAANASRTTVNFVNGALGSIKRFRLLADNKVVMDLENPSLLKNAELYAKNNPTQLCDLQYHYMGNQFMTDVKDSDGQEFFSERTRMMIGDTAQNRQNCIVNNVGIATDSPCYAIPLRLLGADFLDAASLPVFLMNDRELIIEITFHTDCRQYLCKLDGGLVAGQSNVNLNRCELVSTHILLDDEVIAQERAAIMAKPVNYPLLDAYVIKGSKVGLAQNVASPSTYRLNLQNRELHKLLIVPSPVALDAAQTVMAHQKARGQGDLSLQLKVNGLNYFDRAITNPAQLFQLTNFYNDFNTLKIPYFAFNLDSVKNAQPKNTNPTTQPNSDYHAGFQYLGVDFENGNSGIFGAGTVMKTSMEIEHTCTPIDAISAQACDMFFYVRVSKLLSIGGKSISVSF